MASLMMSLDWIGASLGAYRPPRPLSGAVELPAPWPFRPGARGPTRRGGHNDYSMTNEITSKRAFPLRRKPPRSKILEGFQGTSELLGGGGWLDATGWDASHLEG